MVILHTKGQHSVSQYPDTKSTGVWFEKIRLLSYWVMENMLLCNKKILSRYKHVPVQISALWVEVFGYWCILHVIYLTRTEKREPSSLNSEYWVAETWLSKNFFSKDMLLWPGDSPYQRSTLCISVSGYKIYWCMIRKETTAELLSHGKYIVV